MRGVRYLQASPIALTRAERSRVGELIETLIALLDQDAGDPDLEDDDPDRCLAADDGCAALLDPSLGQRRWFAA